MDFKKMRERQQRMAEAATTPEAVQEAEDFLKEIEAAEANEKNWAEKYKKALRTQPTPPDGSDNTQKKYRTDWEGFVEDYTAEHPHQANKPA